MSRRLLRPPSQQADRSVTILRSCDAGVHRVLTSVAAIRKCGREEVGDIGVREEVVSGTMWRECASEAAIAHEAQFYNLLLSFSDAQSGKNLSCFGMAGAESENNISNFLTRHQREQTAVESQHLLKLRSKGADEQRSVFLQEHPSKKSMTHSRKEANKADSGSESERASEVVSNFSLDVTAFDHDDIDGRSGHYAKLFTSGRGMKHHKFAISPKPLSPHPRRLSPSADASNPIAVLYTHRCAEVVRENSDFCGSPTGRASSLSSVAGLLQRPISVDNLLRIFGKEQRFVQCHEPADPNDEDVAASKKKQSPHYLLGVHDRSQDIPKREIPTVFRAVPFLVTEKYCWTLWDATVTPLYPVPATIVHRWLLEAVLQVRELHLLGVVHNLLNPLTIVLVDSDGRGDLNAISAKISHLNCATMLSTDLVKSISPFTLTVQRADPTSNQLRRLPLANFPMAAILNFGIPPEWQRTPTSYNDFQEARKNPRTSAQLISDALVASALGVTADPSLREIFNDIVVPRTASDIYQLGITMKTVLFLDRTSLPPNPRLSAIDEIGLAEGRHLVRSMIRQEPSLRWTLSDILCHPFWWPVATQIEMLSLFAEFACPYVEPEEKVNLKRKTSNPTLTYSSKRTSPVAATPSHTTSLRRKDVEGFTVSPSKKAPFQMTAGNGGAKPCKVSRTLSHWCRQPRQWMGDASEFYDALCMDNKENTRYDYDNVVQDQIHFCINVYKHIRLHGTESICGGDANSFVKAFLHQRFSGLLLELCARLAANSEDAQGFAKNIESKAQIAEFAGASQDATIWRTCATFICRLAREEERETTTAMIKEQTRVHLQQYAGLASVAPSAATSSGKPASLWESQQSDDEASVLSFSRPRPQRKRSFKVMRSSDLAFSFNSLQL